jgi:hypothetical protein
MDLNFLEAQSHQTPNLSILQRLGLIRTGTGQSDAHLDQADEAATAGGQRPAATVGACHEQDEPQR